MWLELRVYNDDIEFYEYKNVTLFYNETKINL